MIDGLGAVGGGYHTENEFLYAPSLVTRSDALFEFLTYIEKYYVKVRTRHPNHPKNRKI